MDIVDSSEGFIEKDFLLDTRDEECYVGFRAMWSFADLQS